jgi:hypothetical protein
MNFINNLIRRLSKNTEPKEYINLGRNELCYCNSGKKFKLCHLSSLEKKGKIAVYEIDIKTGAKKIRIFSERKYKGITIKFETSLRGQDVGTGSGNNALQKFGEDPLTIHEGT